MVDEAASPTLPPLPEGLVDLGWISLDELVERVGRDWRIVGGCWSEGLMIVEEIGDVEPR